MTRLLIVDDNEQITDVLTLYAEKEGFETVAVSCGEDALSAFRANTFDLILLDLMIPGIDGLDVCRQIRKVSDIPIIMVTARSEDYERIMGLEIGADDYIVKPFSPGEVMARVKAVLRRISKSEASGAPLVIFTLNLMIDLDAYLVKINGQTVPLTKRECEILWLLCGNPDKVFTRTELLNRLWGYDYYGDTRTVDSHVKRLRSKISRFEHPLWDIKTIWGVGYKFEKNIKDKKD
ncbi:response regulator transcription factor [Anaerovorax odorimutans]|uniref:Stage 0 sporulation protein A homolog n=1 Tax=Anaerovorax odorimutans TaxID=109327 RepID=A0ABT1RMC0_9FIRM|nr:response regulator transcription factor [Anaerovorax odorimutans]MCQ4636346.1 response regulator transcription factor [Anaerovorax odorimutans]